MQRQRPRSRRALACTPRLLLLLLPPLLQLLLAPLLLSLPPTARAEQPPAASASPSTTMAPGGFSSKGELPQMDFARLGAQKAAVPSLCARVGDTAFFLCCRSGGGRCGPEELQALREEVGDGGGGSGLHLLAPGLGCLCQGHDGDVLAQVSALRREAERYQAVFGHPIAARTLALRAAEALQGKGQQTWSRPPACITVIAGTGSTNAQTAAELYQLDPVGLVFPVKGLAFSGVGMRNAAGEEDVTGEALNAWLAEGGGAGADAVNRAGKGEEAAVWRRLWGGMVACYPSLAGREGEVECAVVAGRGGFRRLGALDRVLARLEEAEEGGEER